MSMDASNRPTRGGGNNQDLWPKWMWIAVPVLVVVVVVGLWWAIFAPTGEGTPTPTPTPVSSGDVIQDQPTQAPTEQPTLDTAEPTPTREVLPELPTATPEASEISTPAAESEGGAEEESDSGTEEMAIGAKVAVTGTGGTGLNMRSGAGTGHNRVKTLSDNAVVEVVGGPKDSDGYTWWQVQDTAGTTGWVASKYLVIK